MIHLDKKLAPAKFGYFFNLNVSSDICNAVFNVCGFTRTTDLVLYMGVLLLK